MNEISIKDRFQGCLLGLAVGDAVGTVVEFKPRGTFQPVTDMTGGGPFHLKPGQWTDDTSMALCLAESLVEKRSFDPKDQMARYVRWMNEGHLSSTGVCFDIGNTTRAALYRYQQTGDPFSGSSDPHSAGNGSIMRLASVPMFYSTNPAAAEIYALESSRTTHGALECLDACRLLGAMLVRALSGAAKETILTGGTLTPLTSPKIAALARGEYRQKTEKEIKGTGYVAQSLEAALWCFDQASDYRSTVLLATNLGDDADTTAAIAGQLAGAFYGIRGIPTRWVEKIALRDQIIQFSDDLLAFGRIERKA